MIHTRKPNQQQHTENFTKQTADIHTKIDSAFAYDASLDIIKFLQRGSEAEVSRLKKGMDDSIFNPLNDVLTRLNHDQITNSERNGLMKQYFQLIHPKTFVTELNTAISIKQIKNDYCSFLAKVVKNTSFPTILQRYKADDRVFTVYQNLLFERTGDIFSQLQKHAEQINSHLSLLESLAREKEGKQLLQIGAGLLGSFAAGPLGGIVSRNIVKAFSNDEAYINHSLSEVVDTWNQVIKAYNNLIAELKDCFAAIFTSLYGGYFLKIQQDLKTLGYETIHFDASSARLEIGVKESEKQRIIMWMHDNEKALLHVLGQQKFVAASQLMAKIEQYTNANQPVNDMLINGVQVKDIVLQMKYNYFVTYIERALWEQKKYREALRYYINLVKELPPTVGGQKPHTSLNIPRLEIIFLRMIHAAQQQELAEVYEAFYCYWEQRKSESSLPIQFAKSFELFTGLSTTDRKIRISVKEIPWDLIIEDNQKLLNELGIEKNTFLKHNITQRRLKKLKLQLFVIARQHYKEWAKRYPVLKKRFVLPLIMFGIVSWNTVSFAYAGKLAPGLDSLYFNQIENKFMDTDIENFALKKALDRSDYHRVLMLIEEGADPNLKGKNGKTVLANAIADKQPVTFIKKLLVLSANPNKRSGDGTLPLQSSLEVKNVEVTKLLLDYGANPNAKKDGIPLLFIAISMENENLVKTLLKSGVDVKTTDQDGNDAFQYLQNLEYNKNHSKTMSLLLQYAYSRERNYPDAELVIWAIQHKDLENLKMMLRMKADPNAMIDGKPILFHVVDEETSSEIIELLFTYKANPDLRASNGEHLLIYTIKKEKDQMGTVTLLLERGINPNVTGQNGQTPLILASQKGSLPLVELLLEKGAIPNISDKDGKSAVLYAAASKDDSVFVKLLPISKVEGPVLENWLIDSVKENKVERVKALLAKNTNPNVADQNGEQLIFLAVKNKNKEVVQILLEAGADPNIMNKEMVTPLQFAQNQNLSDIVKLLEANGANSRLVILKQLEGYWTRDHDEADVVKITKTSKGLLFESTFQGRYSSYSINENAELLYNNGGTQRIEYDPSDDTFYIMSGTYRRITKEDYNRNVKVQNEEKSTKESQQQMLHDLVGTWVPVTSTGENSSIHISQFDSSPIVLRVDVTRINGSHMFRINEDYAEFIGKEIHVSQFGRNMIFKVIDKNTIQYAEKGMEFITLKR